VLDVANWSFLKSSALYKTLDNRKLLAEEDALITKRLDEYLDMRNKFYDDNQKHTLETYLLKQQIKGLEEEKAKFEEQLQSAKVSKYSNRTWLLLRVVLRIDEIFLIV
jgi:hypothetical protein